MLSLLLSIIGSGLYYLKLRSSLIKEVKNQCITAINNVNKDISLFFNQYRHASQVLANLSEIKNCVKSPTKNNLNNVNKVLDVFSLYFNIDVCYIMDKKGITIASSNRNSPSSFVGKNFSFRPYFKNAILGNPTTYPALGTTSKKRGIYFSYPVYLDGGKKPSGVVIIKASVDFLESRFLSKFPGIFFFVNPDGIIFISNKKEWIFFTTHYLDNNTIYKIKKTRQMGNGPWLYSGFRFKKDIAFDVSGNKYLVFERAADFFPGWRLIYLLDERQILNMVHKPILQVAGPFIVMILIIIAVLVYVLAHVAQKELRERENIEKKLRESEEKYRSIYNNTPAMLHSIDREYRLLRVSDYWLDLTGYTRDEVIGKKLTSFFTEESRKLAEEKILPNFFKIGKAKNIHYQFVKKNGEVMDILLSCYGIKDNKNKVIETLAISVDVTERLKEQRELRETKKKLSAYSKKLEKLVRQRTQEISSILKYSPSMIYLKNSKLEFKLVNPGFERFFNTSNNQLVGIRGSLISDNPIFMDFEAKDKEVLETKKPLKTKEIIEKDGKSYTFFTMRFPIFTEGNQVQGICAISTDITELERTQKKLKELSRNIIKNQEMERERISKELHDELGQILTVLNMDVSWLKRKLGEESEYKKRIAGMQDLINKTIDEVRSLAFQLRPGSIDHLGLEESVESLISDFEKRTNIIYTYKKNHIPHLDSVKAIAIYRIAQEAITNAVRHARANKISVILKAKNGNVILKVGDDGIGFDINQKREKGTSFGLMGMQERAELIGGEIIIKSKASWGTKVIGIFPV
ncbi:PAS domain S-box protein [Desulfothermus okinawensis]